MEVIQRTSKIREQASATTTELFKEVRTIRECTMEPAEAHKFDIQLHRIGRLGRTGADYASITGTLMYAQAIMQVSES